MKILAVELSDEECANILTTAIESGHDGNIRLKVYEIGI